MRVCCSSMCSTPAFTKLSEAGAMLLCMTKSKKLDEKALARVLRKQHQVIARSQALSCGMTPGALRHRIRPGGPWQRLLPGTYLAATGTPTVEQKEIAALAYAGRGSVITGPAALSHHRVRPPDVGYITVLIPAEREARNVAFVRIWRTARMPPVVLDDHGVRIVFLPRAIADTARVLSGLRDVRAVVADAVQSGLCTIAQLAEELERAPRRNSALLRRRLPKSATACGRWWKPSSAT